MSHPVSPRPFCCSCLEDAWGPVIAPWCRQYGRDHWPASPPAAIVTPKPVWTAAVKARLARVQQASFGIHFWNPHQLRSHLLAQLLPKVTLASREDLRYLLSLAADQAGDSPSHQVLAAEPDDFLRVYKHIAQAGLDSKAFTNPLWQDIAHCFEQKQQASGLLTQTQADKLLLKLLKRTGGQPPTLSALLLVGFNGRDCQPFPLLQAAVLAAEQATICLDSDMQDDPGLHAGLGLWEDILGELTMLPPAATKSVPYQDLAETFAGTPGAATDTPPVAWRIANTIHEEAQAIVQQALIYLAEAQEPVRLGIVFSQPNALHHLVSSRLNRLDIPYYDALGRQPPRTSAQHWLQAWFTLQEEPRLSHLRHFVQHCQERSLVGHTFLRRIERAAKQAFGTVLTDDLGVISAWLSEQNGQGDIADWLNSWIAVPEQAPFQELIASALSILKRARLGDALSLEQLALSQAGLARAIEGPTDRRRALAWLNATLRLPGRESPPLANQPLAHIILLTPEDALGQNWSHLILAGLNQHSWPPPAYEWQALPESRIDALNQAALRTGFHGEGHVSLASGRGWIISPQARYNQAFTTLPRLLSAVGARVAVTASLATEANFQQNNPPSDLLLKLYHSEQGFPLTTAQLKAFATATHAWLLANHDPKPEPDSLLGNVTATAIAYQARRDAQQPFGPFEFSYREPPKRGLRFSCTTWESLLKRPASVWLEQVLKAPKPKTFTESPQWSLAVGTWVHHWLRLEEVVPFQRLSQPTAWRQSVTTHAHTFHHTIQRAYSQAGRLIPDWWQGIWNEAYACATNLATALEGVDGWNYLAVEWKLPKSLETTVGPQGRLTLDGRMDLVLANAPVTLDKVPGEPASVALWVIDFKTGRDRPLNQQRLQRGDGLQIALYAMAWRALGYTQVQASLLSPHAPLEAQLAVNDLLQEQNLWEGLAAVQATGRVGMYGNVQDKYAFVGDYPVATLPVPQAILRTKWQRSHPQLPLPS